MKLVVTYDGFLDANDLVFVVEAESPSAFYAAFKAAVISREVRVKQAKQLFDRASRFLKDSTAEYASWASWADYTSSSAFKHIDSLLIGDYILPAIRDVLQTDSGYKMLSPPCIQTIEEWISSKQPQKLSDTI